MNSNDYKWLFKGGDNYASGIFFPKLISFSLFDIVIIINMAIPAETEHESLSIFFLSVSAVLVKEIAFPYNPHLL